MNKSKKEEVEIFCISEFTFFDFIASSKQVKEEKYIKDCSTLYIINNGFMDVIWIMSISAKILLANLHNTFFLSIGLLLPLKEFFAIKKKRTSEKDKGFKEFKY
jgi:hypothetical protein